MNVILFFIEAFYAGQDVWEISKSLGPSGGLTPYDPTYVLAPLPGETIAEFVATDRAQPGEQGRLAPKRMQFLHRAGERDLDDVPRRFGVLGHPRHREPVEACKILVEKPVEGGRIAGKQLFYKPFIIQMYRHRKALPASLAY